MTPLQDVIVDEPKAACQKCAFAFGQAITRIFSFITQNKFPIEEEFILDCPKRSLDPWVACWKETHERDHQQAGIEPLRAVGLHKAVKIAVETALTDFGMIRLAISRQRCGGSSNSPAASSFAARSNATQAITFE